MEWIDELLSIFVSNQQRPGHFYFQFFDRIEVLYDHRLQVW